MKKAEILVTKAPDDPEAQAAWADDLMRVQVAMWLERPTACAQCRQPYAGVDDFLARNPHVGEGFLGGKDWDDAFVDDACWPAYAAARGLGA